MNKTWRSAEKSGWLALAVIVASAGCVPKRAVRPPAAPQPIGLQSVIAIDRDGNQVLAGSFRGELTIGGAKLVSAGGTDAYISKTGPSGAAIFPPQRFGGAGDDAVTGVAIDEDRSIVIVGTFQGEAAFGMTRQRANVRHAGQRAVFAAKLDATGKLVWFKQVAVANLPTQVSVAIRPDHSIVIGASTTGTLANRNGMATLSGESIMLDLLSPVGEALPLPPEFKVQAMSLSIGCTHSPCKQGNPLTAGCGYYGCTATICADNVDPYCCHVAWDSQCVAEVTQFCQRRCDCAGVFTNGLPYYPDASPCVTAVFTRGGDGSGDPYCSDVWWDDICIAETGWPLISPACHPACQ